MHEVRLDQTRIRVGRWFAVEFQRTLRIPDDGRDHPLPPGFGGFPLRRAREHATRVPASWVENDALMLPMHRHEALWLSFAGCVEWHPVAVKVSVGGVNALTGDPHSPRLTARPQDYLVAPEQPWLDGIKAGEGIIRQFVAAPLSEGDTVEGQVTGDESVGGLQLTVIEPCVGRFPVTPPVRPVYGVSEDVVCYSAPMGLGAGGRMRQKVYPDEHGIETWDQSSATPVHVQIVDARDWMALTGEAAPPSPISVEQYNAMNLPWFALSDEELEDLPVPNVLASVKPIGAD